jgi:putative ABC transport system ATP-binding protein
MVEQAVQVENLVKIYRENKVEVIAVDGVSFSISKGEVIGILGPSGSGKTTLLSMMGCILRPTQGSIKIFNREVTNLGENELPFVRRKFFGFIFQGFNLFPPLTVLENVKLPLELRDVPRQEAEKLSLKLLEKVGLKERVHFLPRDLSGGEKQRVAIARALAGNPSIILADEPTGNLDHKSGRLVIETLRELVTKNNACAVIVTHDNRIFQSLDRVFYIEDGKLKE